MSLQDQTQAYYRRNRREGIHPKLGPYRYTAPSERHPYQWLWDSAFHAVVLAHWDPEAALVELETLFRVQRTEGFVPHMVYWPDPPVLRQIPEAERLPGGDPGKLVPEIWHAPVPPYATFEANPRVSDAYSALIQPPVFGIVLRRLRELLGDGPRLRALWRPSLAFSRWLLCHRDPDGDHLVSILQSRESGMDYSPVYDPAWRHAARRIPFLADAPLNAEVRARISDRVFVEHNADLWDLSRIFQRRVFDVEDLLVNTLLARNLWDLAELGDRWGFPEAREARVWARAVESAVLSRLWHPEDQTFYSLHHPGPQEVWLRVETAASLLPLGLPHLKPEQESALLQALRDPQRFGVRFPVPSVAASEEAFNPSVAPGVQIWRGPTWINLNWLLARFLRERGHIPLAQRLARASLDLVNLSGFREYFHPFTGEGGGAFHFGWTGLVLDLAEGAGES